MSKYRGPVGKETVGEGAGGRDRNERTEVTRLVLGIGPVLDGENRIVATAMNSAVRKYPVGVKSYQARSFVPVMRVE
jgi:hypothetical protein